MQYERENNNRKKKTPVILTQANETESDIFTCVCMCDCAHHREKKNLKSCYVKKRKISLSGVAGKEIEVL